MTNARNTDPSLSPGDGGEQGIAFFASIQHSDAIVGVGDVNHWRFVAFGSMNVGDGHRVFDEDQILAAVFSNHVTVDVE
ncbi:hypothetical protein D3C73_950830 [compost metagenome]